MAKPDRLDHYFLVGLEALRLLEHALATAGKPQPATILDLPCGYGRVLRMLRAAFPEAAITACDLDRRGVEFCEQTFGVDGAHSERQFDELSLGRTYELVWCGSLLTHLPEDDARAALRALARHLAPEGVIVFTTHGDHIRRLLDSATAAGTVDDPAKPELLRAYERVEEPAKSELLRAYDEEGFGFAPYSHSHDASYGFALSSRDWVEARLAELPEVVHLSSLGAAWHGRQDVYVCQGKRN
jgi:SAM-dependent methyltransferase